MNTVNDMEKDLKAKIIDIVNNINGYLFDTIRATEL